MNVYKSLESLPRFKNAVITIGTFDGVHFGHQQIIKQLKEEAKNIDGESVLITFHPHPRKIVGDTSGVNLLSTLDEKIALLASQQIDNLVIVDFNDDFSQLSANEYVTEFLYRRFKPHTVIIGYDHKFGKGRQGDYHLLEEFGKELGFVVKEIPEQVLHAIIISSTQIRKALLHSDIATANEFLGYDYFFEGIVIEGDKIGRTIGYPTANIQLNNEDKLVPGDGVYAVTIDNAQWIMDNENNSQLLILNSQLKGMMYIGSRPVVNGKRRVIEVNIFDFDEDIYGKMIKVSVKQFIRGDMHFNGLEELKIQLAKDKIDCLRVLG